MAPEIISTGPFILIKIICYDKLNNFIIEKLIEQIMFIKLYFIALPIFLAIDLLWLGIVTKGFYAKQIGFLMKPEINWLAVIIFYLIFISGLVIFVIAPAIEKESWMNALALGALFGFVCYATYDLTNLAITKDWPLLITIIDLLWGAVITASVSTITYFIASKIWL